MTTSEKILLMRKLNRAGVTDFVVNGTLFEELKRHLREVNEETWLPVGADDAPIYFRGRRILQQCDLQHLPFDHSSNATAMG